ncbi:hypothetical protein ALQ80_200194 [Pseudomonas coronafaciens pv. oryzae]|uniref:Uncharacterized protein n=1 Tax=Pseudomonas savastanoi pv. phaseolicola TaxID=319 RepID=A0A7Z6Y5M1_PSESH|nr:hypothetical protein ALQ92_200126 [Pseudomonas syringae pv. pisi]RMM29746.1 hypothetical protein ALQ82_200012 [Pseudomonas syringae pv. pisi]RMM36687.1 hypothetical protein ALQ80_200194 [Pseudomonas coronafaciens pv. oryzae]RMN49157.1 hypothetical protein ALQ58_200416 [Pseudomonas syringae pv. apii]RMU81977.1 hypothetical protein ALP21_200319 [Pseudomonas savastanoi pv. phaseolicola]
MIGWRLGWQSLTDSSTQYGNSSRIWFLQSRKSDAHIVMIGFYSTKLCARSLLDVICAERFGHWSTVYLALATTSWPELRGHGQKP